MSHVSAPPPASEAPPFRPVRRVRPISPLRPFPRLALWYRRARTRAQLARLEAAALRDIGVTEAERRAECRLWFWRGSDG